MPELPQNSKRLERLASVAFGLNVWVWAVLSIAAAPPDQRFHVVRLCVATIHFVVGALFLTRRPLITGGRPRHLLAAVPAVVLSGVAFAHAPSCREWNELAVSLFVAGTVIAVTAFLALAGNFAVLPAVRGVTTSGPYRVVRHPAYLGETILVMACVVAKVDVVSITILLTTIAAVVLRIRAEEAVLALPHTDAAEKYNRYRERVRYRYVPGLW